jgi:predicted dithiol-disulfide oxidoreductase (DUF899 family)
MATKAMSEQEELQVQIADMEKNILEEKKKLTKLRKELQPEEVQEYTFTAHNGAKVTLSEMFGSHDDLIMVHNMGKSCPYCTLWADGFIGVVKHLENRAGFVVISKDDPKTQKEFYDSRGWNFKMYSSHDNTFNKDMKMEAEDGKQWPGISAFHKEKDGTIYRTGFTYFGPGDDFSAIWHMFDLLKGGPDGWQPKYTY